MNKANELKKVDRIILGHELDAVIMSLKYINGLGDNINKSMQKHKGVLERKKIRIEKKLQ